MRSKEGFFHKYCKYYTHDEIVWPVIRKYEIRRDIMNGMINFIYKLFDKTSKMIAIRLELRMSVWTNDNAPVSDLFKKLKQKIKSHYGKCYMGYVWVREQHLSDKQHYHIAVLMDGQKVRHSNTIYNFVNELWIYGHVPKGYIKFHRVHRELLHNVSAMIYHLSYLAKAETKGWRDPAVKDYQISRIIKL